MNALSISVIIPVHRGGPILRRCLLSLSQARPGPQEIIVVIDGHDPSSAEAAAEFGARVLTLAERGGPARARNVGGAAAKGDILFFVDADVTIPDDAMNRVEAAFRADPDLSAAFGSYDDSPAADNFFSQFKNLFHHYVHQRSRPEASTFWAACGAMRRGVFMASGGFDETYRRASIEDIELGYRLTRAGHRIKLQKDLQVKHLKRWTFASLLATDFFQRALPWSELILRRGGFINDLNLNQASQVSVVLACILAICLIASFWWPRALVIAGASAASLAAINVRLYFFFWRKRGPFFTSGAVAWHWFYYLYSGLAFCSKALLHLALTLKAALKSASFLGRASGRDRGGRA